MAQTKKLSLEECLAGTTWYKCALPMTIFFIFVILFVYAIYVLLKCSSLIREHSQQGDAAFEEKYGKKVTDITKVYVINMIVMIVSLIVIVFFLHKAIPVNRQALFFNEYLGAFIVLFIFVVSAWTLAVFNTIKAKETIAVTITSIVMIVALLGIALYGYQIYKYSKGPSGRMPSHRQQQVFHDARSP